MKGFSRMFGGGGPKGPVPSRPHSQAHVHNHSPKAHTPNSSHRDKSTISRQDGFNSFTFNPLNETVHEFRLLTIFPGTVDSPINCSLASVYLQHQLPEYDALSCSSGQGSSDWKILVDGQDTGVREQVASALRALRYQDKPRTIWAEAVCVNASNPAERSSQLQLKHQIFSRAAAVVIWLGPGTTKTQEIFRVVERHVESMRNSEITGVDWDDAYGHAIIGNIADEILSRKWWSWGPAVQEVVDSTNVTIKCGSLSITWIVFVGLLEFLRARSVESTKLLSNKFLDSTNTIKTMYDSSTRQHLCQLLLRLCHYDSSDFREIVSVAFGVREKLINQLPIVASFTKSALEIQLDIVNACIHFDQSLDFLSLAGLGESATPTKSSWLPELQESQPAWRNRTILAESSYSHLVAPTSSRSASLFSAAANLPPTVDITASAVKPNLTAAGLAIDQIEIVPTSSFGRSTPSLLKTWEIVLSYAFGTLEAFQSLTDRWAERMTPRILNPESKKSHYVSCLVDGNSEHCELRRELFRKARDVLLKNVPNYTMRRTRPRYTSPAAFQNAYFRTILTDRNSKRERVTAAYLRASMTDLEGADEAASAALLNDLLPNVPPQQRKGVFHDEFLAAVETSVQFRTLFVTKTGYIGLGPLTMQPNDLVAVLLGYSVPVVLRHLSQSTSYAVVGECYVAGIMDGEALGEEWEERKSIFSIA